MSNNLERYDNNLTEQTAMLFFIVFMQLLKSIYKKWFNQEPWKHISTDRRLRL